MINKFISFWSTRSRLRRSIFVFFRIFLFRFKTMTKNGTLFVTIITFDIYFIHAKTINVKFFTFFINIRIFYRCLSINRCVNVLRKIFHCFFFEYKMKRIFFYHFDYCFLSFWQSSKLIQFALITRLDFLIKIFSFSDDRFLTEFA